MIDLMNATWRSNRFGGSEKKKALLYNGKAYMVKFPDPRRSLKTGLSYINNQYSEHIGCSIFNLVNVPAQNTFLARCQDPTNGKEKIVVACELFDQQPDVHLIEFSKFVLNDTDSARHANLSIEDVMDVIDNYTLLKDKQTTKDFFWDMFVVDAYLGNPDRHLDNWGFLEDANGILSPAPVYDCGSCLSPKMTDEEKDANLNAPGAMSQDEYNICSVYHYQGERIYYHSFLKNPPVEDLRYAILRMVPQINLQVDAIRDLIDGTEGMSPISKDYMKASLELRREKILQPAYDKADKRERERGYIC